MKDINHTTPITDIITSGSPFGLWGVTSTNNISPSGTGKLVIQVLSDHPVTPDLKPSIQGIEIHSLAVKISLLGNEFNKIQSQKIIPSILSEVPICNPSHPVLDTAVFPLDEMALSTVLIYPVHILHENHDPTHTLPILRR